MIMTQLLIIINSIRDMASQHNSLKIIFLKKEAISTDGLLNYSAVTAFAVTHFLCFNNL